MLLDVMVDIPTIFELSDIMNTWTPSPKKEAERTRLTRACLDVRDRAIEWYSFFGDESVLSRPSEENPDAPHVYDARDLTKTHIMTLYWALIIIITFAWRDLVEPDQPYPDGVDPDDCCRKIAKTIDLFVRRETGLFRVHLTSFVLSVSLIHLSTRSPDEMAEPRQTFVRYLNSPECAMMKQFLTSLEGDRIKPFHGPLLPPANKGNA